MSACRRPAPPPKLPEFGIRTTGDVFIPEHLHEDAQARIEVICPSMPPAIRATVDGACKGKSILSYHAALGS